MEQVVTLIAGAARARRLVAQTAALVGIGLTIVWVAALGYELLALLGQLI